LHGVYEISNTAYNYHYPNVELGESQFIFITDQIVELDNARTYKEIDKNLGRGRALIPQVFSNNNSFIGGNANVSNMLVSTNTNSMDFTFMQPYQILSGNEQKPLSIQFDLRTNEWRQEIEGVIGDICTNFGISILDVDPRLMQGGNRTDDEISALNDITISTIIAKRELAENSINDMLKTISIVLGLNENLRIRWSMEGLMNKSKVIDIVARQLENGLISKRTALKKINPDMNEQEIEEEFERIKNDTDDVNPNDVFNEL
jgi:Phage portal protein, SPP1 Gp6-like.